ncbi:Uncharacterised protein [Rodentibacter pneumotropicus]|uniref:Uncharacterized protein n=1 Tax=Rodentibacter pneumotropicus TaxID=758 RepID=A0A448MK53_9PAST|nr:Uncharacterised protein [Rodentibacter pneumotropicus]
MASLFSAYSVTGQGTQSSYPTKEQFDTFKNTIFKGEIV